MRILILSANTGGGHNAAANAIQEELRCYGIDADIEDCLRFVSEKASDFISWGHSYIYKHLPQLFGRVYSSEEQRSSQFIYDTIALGASKYHAFIRERDYAAVVCVHVFASSLVTEEQRRYGKTLPHYFVSTDYTCSPGVGEVDADAWLIPDASLTAEFTQAGVPAERIVPTGIPIHRDFTAEVKKSEARRQLGLPPDGRVVLFCFGSIGCGKINKIMPTFGRRLPSDVTPVVVCGNNSKLYEQLNDCVSPRTVVVGFTDKIALYMAAADICISKPGGLSTTELLAVGVPSVFVLVVPGCESRNLEFVTSRSLACGAMNWEEATAQAFDLLAQPEKLAQLRAAMTAFDAGHGAKNIADYVYQALAQK